MILLIVKQKLITIPIKKKYKKDRVSSIEIFYMTKK